MRREYKNFRLEVPYTHAIYNATTCLQSVRWLNDEYIAVFDTERVEADDLRAFIGPLLDRLFVEYLVHGNVTSAV